MKQLSDCRLLLVDDAKVNLDILVEGLKADHKLSLALSGEMALHIAASTPLDLVLLDIVMPGLDGYEVCRRLRLIPWTADVPIIFLSSLEDVQDKSRGFEAGANDYVTKPFNLLEVKARVRGLLKAKLYSDSVKELRAAELGVAREIQMGMIPHDFSQLEKAYNVQLAGTLEPAREVGGDLYTVFPGMAGRLVMLIGDVSGKGIPASLFMVRASSLARLLGRDNTEPERILARLNDELSADNPSGMFVTMICVVFNPATGHVAMANAGHNRPVLLQEGREPKWAVEKLGTALGFEPGLVFERTDLTLKSGDSLVLYTDGVNEAFNPEGECYGNERLLKDSKFFVGQSAETVMADMLQNVRTFAAGAPQSDDIAILVFRLQEPVIEVLTMELHATPQAVMQSVEQLRGFCRGHGVAEQQLFGPALALEECAANIMHHACHDKPEEVFSLRLSYYADQLTIELRDRGPAFDPTQTPAENFDVEQEDRPAGGWGIHLVRHYMDEIIYRREASGNVLRMVKLMSKSA